MTEPLKIITVYNCTKVKNSSSLTCRYYTRDFGETPGEVTLNLENAFLPLSRPGAKTQVVVVDCSCHDCIFHYRD